MGLYHPPGQPGLDAFPTRLTPKKFTSVLAGPTCDSIDVIAEGIDLPEFEPGDYVIGRQMGAYTAATVTHSLLPKDCDFPVTIEKSESVEQFFKK